MTDLRRLRAALREELAELWHDLAAAHRRSRTNPPEQSPQCRNLIRRITAITAEVGPTPPGDIEFAFLLTGLYQRIHQQLHIDVHLPEGLLQHARDHATPGGRLALGYPEGLVEEHRDRRIYFLRKDNQLFFRISDRTGPLSGRFDTVEAARTAFEDDDNA